MGIGIIIPKKPMLSILCGGIIFIASVLFKFLSAKGEKVLTNDAVELADDYDKACNSYLQLLTIDKSQFQERHKDSSNI